MIAIPARHVRKGDCIIRELPEGGRVLVLVDYPDLGLVGRPACIDELVDRQTGKPISFEAPPPPAAPKPTAPSTTPVWQKARQVLLALRLGQSTHDSVNELTVGMQEVKVACDWAIRRASTGQISFLVFESPYGMGKSHALGYLRIRAREAGMATGCVVLDGTGVSLCVPMKLIGALAHTVEYPGAAGSDGLPQKLAALVVHGEVGMLRLAGAEFLYGALEKLKPEHVEDPDVWEGIEDYLALETSAHQVFQSIKVRVRPLAARYLEDRPSRGADLIREWAQACTVTGGRGGLAVFFDEADVDYGQRGRSRTEGEQRSRFLEALRQSADGGPKAGSYGRLVIAMAITPGASEPDPVEELRSQLGLHLRVVRLRELSVDELMDLGQRVAEVYRQAYQVSGKTEAAKKEIEHCLRVTERQAEGRNPRTFVRRLLERLDIVYG